MIGWDLNDFAESWCNFSNQNRKMKNYLLRKLLMTCKILRYAWESSPMFDIDTICSHFLSNALFFPPSFFQDKEDNNGASCACTCTDKTVAVVSTRRHCSNTSRCVMWQQPAQNIILYKYTSTFVWEPNIKTADKVWMSCVWICLWYRWGVIYCHLIQ